MQSPPPSLTHEIVRAGAGAGKTTKLTTKVISVALDHQQKWGHFPKMILTTFTRKATQEIRERLMKLALEKENPDLFDYVNSTSQLHISTIHGVLSAFLSRYGSRIGLSPKFEVISASKHQAQLKAHMRESLLALPETQELLETFSFDQLCGMAQKFYEIWSVGEPKPIQREDFLEAVADLTLGLSRQCLGMARALSELELEGKWLEWQGRIYALADILAQKDFTKARQECLDEVDRLGRKPVKSKKNQVPDEVDEQLKNLLVRLKDLRKPIYDPVQWDAYCQVTVQVARLFDHFSQAFESHKIIEGELLMADLELLAFSILKNASEAASSFAKEWDYWFIDEYQDTSPSQVQLIAALSEGAPSFTVGDPQQSIYLFRGARSEVFTDRESQVEMLGGERALLMKNYRSQPELLEFFNHYFLSFSDQFSAMEAREPVDHDSSSPREVAQILISEKRDTTPVKRSFGDEAEEEGSALEDNNPDEASSVVQRISELLATGVEPSEIAVLARKNSQLELVAELAKRAAIPYQLHSSSGFYGRLEIKDSLALLKFLLNPYDNSNFVRLLRTPWFYVEDAVIAEIAGLVADSKKSKAYWPEARVAFSQIPAIAKLQHWREACEKIGISETFREAVISECLLDSSDLYDPSGRRESNIWKFIAKLKEEEKSEGFSFLEFVNRVEGPSFSAQSDDESDAVPVIEPKKVNLMTVHASKGLQFSHVIIAFAGADTKGGGGALFSSHEESFKWCVSLPDVETQTFKKSLVAEHWKQQLKERELQEQERLLYVAMTRAKDTLTMTWTEPIKKGSWAASFPLSSAEGVHQEKLFSYRVRRENWAIDEKPASSYLGVVNQRLPFAGGTSAVASQISVTALTELALDPEMMRRAKPKRGLSLEQESFDAVEKGVKLHKLFEMLKYFGDHDFSELVHRHFEAEPKLAIQALTYIQELKSPHLSQLIKNAQAEWGFFCQIGDVWLQGQIDLWGRDEKGELWLVDYKTGHVQYLEKAFDQLTLYTLGLKHMGHLKDDKKVNLAVIYPFNQKSFVKEIATEGDEITRFELLLRDPAFKDALSEII